MPKTFGYLNEGNPLTIRDNEAQEMVNCAIERGWIEYKAYPVLSDIYQCVPNREVKLPNGSVLRLKNTYDNYARVGTPEIYSKSDNSYSQFGIWLRSVLGISISYSAPVKATSSSHTQYGYYCECISSATVGEGLNSITLSAPTIDVTGSALNYDSRFIDYSVVTRVTVNNAWLDKSQYTILATENGVPVIVLANPTTQASNTVEVRWNYAFNDGGTKFVIKESQTVFYAFTVKDVGNSSNPNYGYESIPELHSIFVYVDSVGFAIPKITVNIPSDTGAQTPQVNIYRMPFGGSEYLFDFSTTSNISNRLDSVLDSDLGSILETEGNSQDYLYTRYVGSMILHNDRLFLAEDKLLVYSKPSQFNQFPAENFYAFPDEITDLCKYDSNLAVFTKTKSYIIYGAGTDGFVISEVDWKTLWHIPNSAQSIYTKLVSLVADEKVTINNDDYPSTKRKVVCYNHRYAQDISLRIKDTLNKGVLTLKVDEDLRNRNTVIENRYYVAELRYYEHLTDTANQVKTFNLVYDVIADGFCIYDPSVKDFNNQTVFKYRTKEFRMSTSPTPQAQYHKGIYVKGKGTFKVNVYSDGELLTSLTHTETDNSNPMRIILHNMGNKRGSTISLEFIGTVGAQIHDWEVYD